jgi:hypothetical protein
MGYCYKGRRSRGEVAWGRVAAAEIVGSRQFWCVLESGLRCWTRSCSSWSSEGLHQGWIGASRCSRWSEQIPLSFHQVGWCPLRSDFIVVKFLPTIKFVQGKLPKWLQVAESAIMIQTFLNPPSSICKAPNAMGDPSDSVISSWGTRESDSERVTPDLPPAELIPRATHRMDYHSCCLKE